MSIFEKLVRKNQKLTPPIENQPQSLKLEDIETDTDKLVTLRGHQPELYVEVSCQNKRCHEPNQSYGISPSMASRGVENVLQEYRDKARKEGCLCEKCKTLPIEDKINGQS